MQKAKLYLEGARGVIEIPSWFLVIFDILFYNFLNLLIVELNIVMQLS
jgi:hypothetical protein